MARSPRPTAGTWTGGSAQLRLAFDLPLAAGALDPANWTVHAGGHVWTCATISPRVPLPNYVQGLFIFTPTPPVPAGTRVYYSPPPYDLTGENGAPAKPIDGFSLV